VSLAEDVAAMDAVLGGVEEWPFDVGAEGFGPIFGDLEMAGWAEERKNLDGSARNTLSCVAELILHTL